MRQQRQVLFAASQLRKVLRESKLQEKMHQHTSSTSVPVGSGNVHQSICGSTLADVPLHLQHKLFASAAAPLTTCKASSAIAQDRSLTATWLLARGQCPLLRAVNHRLWDVCEHLLGPCHCVPGQQELQEALLVCAAEGKASIVEQLLQHCTCRQGCTGYCETGLSL
jgi:hypothetical protein